MSKKQERLIKAIEKYGKNADKELERAREIINKMGNVDADDPLRPAVDKLVERLKQKELQASGDGMWADEFVAQQRAALSATSEKKAKKAKLDNKAKPGKKAKADKR